MLGCGLCEAGEAGEEGSWWWWSIALKRVAEDSQSAGRSTRDQHHSVSLCGWTDAIQCHDVRLRSSILLAARSENTMGPGGGVRRLWLSCGPYGAKE